VLSIDTNILFAAVEVSNASHEAAAAFLEGVEKISDLKPGMALEGIVTNVTAFGAFVDIGVHQDGLVHVSELSDRYVKNPLEVVKVHQKVQVTVLAVDPERRRIALSMKTGPAPTPHAKKPPGTHPTRRNPSVPPPRSKPEPFNNPFAKLLKK